MNTSMAPTLKRIALVFGLILLVVAGLVASFFWSPENAKVRTILSKAKSVSLAEYRRVTEDLEYSEELMRKTLTSDQIKTISSAFRGLGWMDGAKACMFEPHHALICTMPDGTTHTIHICFSCHDVAIDSGRPFDIHSWASEVKSAIEGCGVPIRPDTYRFGP